jgi:hypothetical protein
MGRSLKRRRMGIKPCRMGLFWLSYKRNGRLAGVAIVSAHSLTAARRAAAHWIGIGAMQFAEGRMLSPEFVDRVPLTCVGKMLSRREAVDMLERIERGVGTVK